MKHIPFILGLTGSIGMGKSTTAEFFRQAGVPVWDADAAVHRLYDVGGRAVEPVSGICPDAVINGSVRRDKLRDWIAQDPKAIETLNRVVHPLVAKDRADFISDAGQSGQPIVIVDVPLLFETGGEAYVDAILVVSAPKEIQKTRVLAREGMTLAHFETIQARQMPDAEKRARADYVIETTTMQSAQQAVKDLLAELKERISKDA